MKIDDRNVTGASASRTADVQSAQSAAIGKGPAANQSRSGTDSVELSGVSRSVRDFQTARSARVEQLAKAVQGGSYSVNPALIGRALVGEALAGGGEGSGN